MLMRDCAFFFFWFSIKDFKKIILFNLHKDLAPRFHFLTILGFFLKKGHTTFTKFFYKNFPICISLKLLDILLLDLTSNFLKYSRFFIWCTKGYKITYHIYLIGGVITVSAILIYKNWFLINLHFILIWPIHS